eukprot:CAMPEP_0119351252 /NCGR_PEP_ID=MMETSP1334-20130426/557_1 /TAXON_ID=127549 /ORGANISM="Calcidiscus leptoporus, Strain RCC1130" /LENGTH=117 /DNA_ID=CAMNT_0007364013 /DNA_START=151 /DNA_END=504 /DNA_ORIENTATION=-
MWSHRVEAAKVVPHEDGGGTPAKGGGEPATQFHVHQPAAAAALQTFEHRAPQRVGGSARHQGVLQQAVHAWSRARRHEGTEAAVVEAVGGVERVPSLQRHTLVVHVHVQAACTAGTD